MEKSENQKASVHDVNNDVDAFWICMRFNRGKRNFLVGWGVLKETGN